MITLHPRGALLALMALSACGPSASTPASALRPDHIKAAEATQALACVDPRDEAEPLIIDLPARRRSDLEARIREGIVFVRYDCQRLELLEDCRLGEAPTPTRGAKAGLSARASADHGRYAYKGSLIKEEVLRLEDADEIRANLPLSGAGIAAEMSGEISRGATLDLAMAIVGQRRAARYEISRGELVGRCAGATHFIRSIYVGAFAMRQGARARAVTAVDLFEVGAGAQSRSARVSAKKDGDLEACRRSAPSAGAPAEGCGALLRLRLSPISAAGADLARAPSRPQAPICPEGMRFTRGKCARAAPAAVCAPARPEGCGPACQAGEAWACRVLGEAEGPGAVGARAFSRGCALGDAASCTRLGRLYSKGVGVSAHAAKGFEAVKRGCDLGDGAGCFYTGLAYMEGDGVARDQARGFGAYEQGCAAGSPAACTNLGKAYSVGRGVKPNVRISFKLYIRACEAGSAQGCYNVGTRYSKGKGTVQDDQRALSYYLRACKLDHAKGCYAAAKRLEDPKLMEKACHLKLDRACR